MYSEWRKTVRTKAVMVVLPRPARLALRNVDGGIKRAGWKGRLWVRL